MSEIAEVPAAHPLSPAELLRLAFRPSQYFANSVRLEDYEGELAVTWIVAMTAVIDRLDGMAWIQSMSWTEYWFTVPFGALVAGLGAWWIWGSIFALRVSWCRPTIRPGHEVRSVYVYSQLPGAVIFLAGRILQTIHNPMAGPVHGIAAAFVFVALVWCTATEYHAVRGAYATQRPRTLVWFVAVPALIYAVVALGYIVKATSAT